MPPTRYTICNSCAKAKTIGASAVSILRHPRSGNAVKCFEAGSGTRQSSFAGHRSGNSGESHYENASRRWRKGSTQSHRRSGQALIEFAFVSIVMVTLFMVAFALGLMLLQSMVTANAGASAGRILHHHPRLSPEAFALMREIDGVPNEFDIANPTASEIMRLITADFTGSMDSAELEFTDRFGGPLYDERLLVLTREEYDAPSALPELNRLLLPNYIYDADRDRFRYPGAVVERDIDNRLTVLVPLTEGIIDACFNTGDCSEYDPDTLTFWLPPLRICKVSNTCDIVSETMPMDLRADGTFAITITFPAQAGSLVAFQPVRDGNDEILQDASGNEIRTRIIADDSALTNLSTLPPGYTLAPVASSPEFASLSTRGDYGLGELAVLDMSQEPFEPILVRPYRRVIGHAATFRLGQRFEAFRRIGPADMAVNLGHNDPPQPEPFSLTGSGAGNYNDANLIATNSAELTIPVQGKWRISAAAEVDFPTAPTGGNLSLWIYRYDADTSSFEQDVLLASTPLSSAPGRRLVSGAIVLSLDEGDQLEVRISQDSGHSDAAVVNSPSTNWISIESVFVKGGHFPETP